MTLRRSFVRWLAAAGTVSLLAGGLAQTSIAATNYTVYNSDPQAQKLEGSEIVDITPDNKYAVIVGANNIGETKLRMFTINPSNPLVKVGSLELDSAVTGLGLTKPVASSVAVHPSGYAIVTIKECTETLQCYPAGGSPPAVVKPGGAVFVNIGSTGALTLARSEALQLGVQPEAIDIAPNGFYAVVANEGTGTNGTISVINLQNAASPTIVSQLPPDPNITDTQPEAVAISPDSTRAFVTLQENNAVAVMDINQTTFAPTTSVRSLGTDPARNNVGLYPDGIAAPDRNHIITANEGITGSRANTVSMFRVNDDRSLTLVGHVGIAASGDFRPEMVDVGTVAGQLRAFVTLEGADAVAVFNVTTTGTPALVLERLVDLNQSQNGQTADAPEGIAIADGLDLIVTANQNSRNISVIKATDTTPTKDYKIFMPMIQRS